MPIRFEDIIRSDDKDRENFLSRFLGIFSEKIVSDWCNNPQAPFEDLGRPSLYKNDTYLKSTLDFTFRDRKTSLCYIVEMKAEMSYQGFKFLRLNNPSQLDHHMGNTAFKRFLDLSKDKTLYDVATTGKKFIPHSKIAGTILLWGAIDNTSISVIKKLYNFQYILSLEDMIEDLIAWKDPGYYKRMNNLSTWVTEFISELM